MLNLPNGVGLPDLTIDDYIVLAEEAWRYRHEAAARTVADSGLKPEDRLRALDQLDQQRGTRGPLVMWAFTYAGSRRVLESLAVKGGRGVAECIAGLTVDQIQRSALEAVGVDLAAAESAGDGGDPTRAPAS